MIEIEAFSVERVRPADVRRRHMANPTLLRSLVQVSETMLP